MFEMFLRDFRIQRIFPRMGTVGRPGETLFLFWRKRRSAWRDVPTQTVARRKSQSSLFSVVNNHGELHIFIFFISESLI